MSLQPQAVYLVPDETARVARAIFPTGNLAMRMYDELGMALSTYRLRWALPWPKSGRTINDERLIVLRSDR